MGPSELENTVRLLLADVAALKDRIAQLELKAAQPITAPRLSSRIAICSNCLMEVGRDVHGTYDIAPDGHRVRDDGTLNCPDGSDTA